MPKHLKGAVAAPGKDEDASPSNAMARAAAKWFIPTATVLFAVIGYIVQTAQEDMLGIAASAHNSTAYINAAALFTRDLIGLPLDISLTNLSALFFGHWLAMLFILAGAALLILSVLPERMPDERRRPAVAMVLIVLFIVKFGAFDVPLTLLNKMVDPGNPNFGRLINPDAPEAKDAAQQLADKKAANGWLYDYASGRSEGFALAIICSHLDESSLSKFQGFHARALALHSETCTPTNEARFAAPRAIFTTIVLLQLLIVIAALLLLREHRRSLRYNAAAILGLLASLTVPYDYGKLLKSTSFEYGIVRLTTPLDGNDGLDNATYRNIGGLILSRDETGTSLLHVKFGAPCTGNAVQLTKNIQLLQLASSQVVSIGQVRANDIFDWAITSVGECPAVPPKAKGG